MNRTETRKAIVACESALVYVGPIAEDNYMANPIYNSSQTGLLRVDPYNDFLSAGGKIWDRVKQVADEVNLLDNLRAIVAAVRRAPILLFIVPHQRWEPGDYEDWAYSNPSQLAIQKRHSFAKGTWGGEWHPDFAPQPGDIIIKEHRAQSGFAHTDLDFQLKQHGITHVIAVACWRTPASSQPSVSLWS
jgi:nicotinamidase-related amidase